MDGHFYNVQRILKTDKKQIHLLPITSNTLNLLRHALTYVNA